MTEPLHTVFDNPIDLEQQKRGRRIFLLLAVFFTIPIVVVMLMFKLNWRPTGKSYGELLQPPVSIQHITQWQDAQQHALPQFWQDKWNMVFVTRHCEQQCMQRLYDMRQIYVSMYKDMPRVQRVLITQDTDVAPILASYPDLLIINGPEASVQALSQLIANGNQNTLQANRVYFIDPLGHVMMQYAQDMAAKYIRHDLVKLLKSSWAG